MKYQKIPDDVSVYVRYLFQDKGMKMTEICERFPKYPQRTLYRHAKKPIGEKPLDKRHKNPGRPKKLSERDGRKLKSEIYKLRSKRGVFNSTHIQEAAGISKAQCSNRTVRRCLNDAGFGYLQCRKKGQVTKTDLKKRVKFARDCKKNYTDDFWTNGISFYSDGVAWAHKTNPCEYAKTNRTRTWRLRSEGLSVHCTAKGKKEGVGGRVAKFFVAISHGSGVVHVEPFHEVLNGESYANFVRKKFNKIFKKCKGKHGKQFLQDGDPSQNSAKAKAAMSKIKCKLFGIPARSPDINVIENVFHLVGKQIREDALDQNITKETFEEFSDRCQRTLENFPQETIDKTIESLWKRMDEIIKRKGTRIEY